MRARTRCGGHRGLGAARVQRRTRRPSISPQNRQSRPVVKKGLTARTRITFASGASRFFARQITVFCDWIAHRGQRLAAWTLRHSRMSRGPVFDHRKAATRLAWEQAGAPPNLLEIAVWDRSERRRTVPALGPTALSSSRRPCRCRPCPMWAWLRRCSCRRPIGHPSRRRGGREPTSCRARCR